MQKFRQGPCGLLRGDRVPRRSDFAFTPVDEYDRTQTRGARLYACRLKCPIEPVFQPLAQFVDLRYLPGPIGLHRRQTRGHGDVVAVKGAIVRDRLGVSRVKGSHNLLPSPKRAQGQPTSNELGYGRQIGCHADSGLNASYIQSKCQDFIKNQQNAVHICQLPDASQVSRLRFNAAAGSEDRFEDDSRDFAAVCAQEILQRIEIIERHYLHPFHYRRGHASGG